jgi:hypothetical protein
VFSRSCFATRVESVAATSRRLVSTSQRVGLRTSYFDWGREKGMGQVLFEVGVRIVTLRPYPKGIGPFLLGGECSIPATDV